ncbi:hypothetical protein [Streptosporangium canum]|uniref:hypothetical protein n=1 Tax=Streptosporangium canum TaxID=324952 RepID=UPI003F4DFD77
MRSVVLLPAAESEFLGDVLHVLEATIRQGFKAGDHLVGADPAHARRSSASRSAGKACMPLIHLASSLRPSTSCALIPSDEPG